MSAGGEEAIEAGSRISRQIPSFAVIGLIGYVVDASVTYLGAKYLGLSPEVARPPGFLIATVVNFALNRAITFRHAKTPLMRAFLRYCLVAAAGLVVNFAVYSLRRLLAAHRPDRDAGISAAVRRRRQRRGDGRHLRRLPLVRVPPLTRQCSSPLLAGRREAKGPQTTAPGVGRTEAWS
jgi:putative flippase GtrA